LAKIGAGGGGRCDMASLLLRQLSVVGGLRSWTHPLLAD